MSNETSPLLAGLSALACVVLSALIYLGHAAAGSLVDFAPCLLTACLTPLVIQTAGRLPGKWAAVIPGCAALVGLLLGKCLAWDLAGMVGRFSAAPDLAAGGWLERLQSIWNALSPAVQGVNAVLYLMTPLLAAAVVPTCRRLEQSRPLQRFQSAAVAPQAKQIPPARRRLIVLGAVWAMLVAGTHLALRNPERSGFLSFTLPVINYNQGNPLFGFANLVDGSPVMAETMPAAEQVTWFGGQPRSDNNFRFLRAGYAFLAVTLLPWLKPLQSLIVLNVLCWLLSLVCIWRTARLLQQDDLTACLAAMLAALGSGYAFHWDAATPHLLSFALYAFGIMLLLQSRIHTTPLPWTVHLRIGLFLGLTSLVYNVWLMLALVYVAAGIRRQRLLYLVGGGLVAIAFQPIWHPILAGLGINVHNVEAEYLLRAVAYWRESLRTGVDVFLVRAAGYFLEAATSLDSPVILLTGLLGFRLILDRDNWLLLLVAIVAPVLACTLFAPVAGARGYIVFGSSCLWFIAAGRLLAAAFQRIRRLRWLVAAFAVGAITIQAGWSTSVLRGRSGPDIIYFLGWDEGGVLLGERPPEVISLTGQDAIPRTWGGTGTAETIHAVREPPAVPRERSRILAYLSRWLFVVGGAVLCCVLAGNRRSRRIAALGWLTAMAIVTEIALCMPPESLTFWEVARALSLQPGESVTTRIHVPAAVQKRLAAEVSNPDQESFLFNPGSLQCEIRWKIDGKPIALPPTEHRESLCPAEAFPTEISDSSTWEITLVNHSSRVIDVAGWQTVKTPGKRQDHPRAMCLPSVEFRVRNRHTGVLQMIAF